LEKEQELQEKYIQEITGQLDLNRRQLRE